MNLRSIITFFLLLSLLPCAKNLYSEQKQSEPEKSSLAWIPQTGYYGSIRNASFRPDGEYFIAQDEWGTVILWHVKSSVQVRRFNYTFEVFGDRIFFNKSGQIISLHKDKARLVDLDGKIIKQFPKDKADIACINHSEGGKYIAVLLSSKEILLLDSETLEIAKKVQTKIENVSYIQISPDGRYLATKYTNEEITIFDVNENRISGTITDPDNSFVDVLIGKNNLVAGTDNKKFVKLYKLDGSPVVKLTHDSYRISHVSFSPDGKYLLFAADKNRIIECDSGKDVRQRIRNNGLSYLAGISRDNGIVVYGYYERIELVDCITEKEKYVFWNDYFNADSADFSHDGAYLLSNWGLLNMGSILLLFDLKTGKSKAAATSSNRHFFDASISPAGRFIAACGHFGNAPSAYGELVIRYDDEKSVTLTNPMTDYLTLSEIDATGSYVLVDSGYPGKDLRLYDKTGELIRIFECENTRRIYFNHTGKYVAAQSYDRLRIWEFNGLPYKDIEAGSSDMSRLSDRIVTLSDGVRPEHFSERQGFKKAQVSDFVTGKVAKTYTFAQQDLLATAVFINANGTRIIIVHKNDTAEVKDVGDDKYKKTFSFPTGYRIDYAMFSPRGTFIIFRFANLAGLCLIKVESGRKLWLNCTRDGGWIAYDDDLRFETSRPEGGGIGLVSGKLPASKAAIDKYRRTGLLAEFIKE